MEHGASARPPDTTPDRGPAGRSQQLSHQPPQQVPRGSCPICGGQFTLRKDGRVWAHRVNGTACPGGVSISSVDTGSSGLISTSNATLVQAAAAGSGVQPPARAHLGATPSRIRLTDDQREEFLQLQINTATVLDYASQVAKAIRAALSAAAMSRTTIRWSHSSRYSPQHQIIGGESCANAGSICISMATSTDSSPKPDPLPANRTTIEGYQSPGSIERNRIHARWLRWPPACRGALSEVFHKKVRLSLLPTPLPNCSVFIPSRSTPHRARSHRILRCFAHRM